MVHRWRHIAYGFWLLGIRDRGLERDRQVRQAPSNSSGVDHTGVRSIKPLSLSLRCNRLSI